MQFSASRGRSCCVLCPTRWVGDGGVLPATRGSGSDGGPFGGGGVLPGAAGRAPFGFRAVPAPPAGAAGEEGPEPQAARRSPPTQREAAAPLPEKVREPGGGRARYGGCWGVRVVESAVGWEGRRLAGVPWALRPGGGRGLNCFLSGAPRGTCPADNPVSLYVVLCRATSILWVCCRVTFLIVSRAG